VRQVERMRLDLSGHHKGGTCAGLRRGRSGGHAALRTGASWKARHCRLVGADEGP
jgi:hypothetical protein